MNQLENLRQVVAGRPCAILLPGPSVSQLEKRIKEIADIDICYLSCNDFWLIENKILSQIGQELDIVLCAAKECNVPSLQHDHFLTRPEANIFLTELKSFNHNLDRYCQKYQSRLFFYQTDHLYESLKYPDKQHPFSFFAQASLAVLISICLMGKSDTIMLFGADGGNRNNEKQLYWGGWKSDSIFRLGYDTGVFNMTILQLLQNVCSTFSISQFRLFNISPDTYYSGMPIIDYDSAFKFLKEEYAKSKPLSQD